MHHVNKPAVTSALTFCQLKMVIRIHNIQSTINKVEGCERTSPNCSTSSEFQDALKKEQKLMHPQNPLSKNAKI